MRFLNSFIIAYRSIYKRIFITILLLCMNVVTFYMLDIVFTSYISSRYALDRITNMFSNNYKDIYYIQCIGNSNTYKNGQTIVNYIKGLENIRYSGFFGETVMIKDENSVNGIVAEWDLMDMGNLNLSDEQKQLLDSNDGYQKVFLGANLEGQYNIGDICTVSPYSKDDAVVAGFLKKGASWAKRGRLFNNQASGDSYVLDNRFILLTKDYSKYDTASFVDFSYEYYYCIHGDAEKINNNIRNFAVKNGLTVSITSIEEMIDKEIEDKGLVHNTNATATVYFMIASLFSMIVTAIVHLYSDRASYGIMISCGMRVKEVIRLSYIYNGAIFLFPSLIIWGVRQFKLFGSLYVGNVYINGNILKENIVVAHEYVLPVILISIVLLMFVTVGIVPNIIFRKMKISDLIQEKE